MAPPCAADAERERRLLFCDICRANKLLFASRRSALLRNAVLRELVLDESISASERPGPATTVTTLDRCSWRERASPLSCVGLGILEGLLTPRSSPHSSELLADRSLMASQRDDAKLSMVLRGGLIAGIVRGSFQPAASSLGIHDGGLRIWGPVGVLCIASTEGIPRCSSALSNSSMSLGRICSAFKPRLVAIADAICLMAWRSRAVSLSGTMPGSLCSQGTAPPVMFDTSLESRRTFSSEAEGCPWDTGP